jgi:hypothetical protein
MMIQTLSAQPFAYSQRDLFVGFRKTGTSQGNYEMVVDIGQATNYVGLAAGTTIPIPHFVPAQLSGAFNNFSNLNWSVNGCAYTGIPTIPIDTLWFTIARADNNVQGTPPTRDSRGNQALTTTQMTSALDGATFISTQLGTSNDYNNVYLVREPIGSQYGLTAWIGDPSFPAIGDFGGTLNTPVENTTPAAFTSPVRSDFYEVRPSGAVDPHTGLISGPGYYVGYFEFSPAGTMTFTRASTNAPPPPPPPPQITQVKRVGTTSTISFTTTNGATYALYYASSLGQSVTNWPALPTTVTGDGTIKSLSDSTTDSMRFYSVGAH